MDNQRLLLFAALSIVVLLLWQSWQQDYGTQKTVATPPAAVTTAPTAPDVPSSAQAPSAPAAAPNVAVAPAAVPTAGSSLKSGQRIHVITDLLKVEIDTIGGDVRRAELLDYPIDVGQRDKPYPLMKDSRPRLFVAQTGLLSTQTAPDHHTPFIATQTAYALNNSEQELRVPLQYTGPNGLTVTKTFVFHRGSYVVDVISEVSNNTGAEWTGRQYRQFQRSAEDKNGEATFIYTYTGGVLYTPEKKYEKISFDDMQELDLSRTFQNGWVAMIQHYFLGAWLPDQGETNQAYTKHLGDEVYVMGLMSMPKTLAAGQTDAFTSHLYVGPKLQKPLEALAPGLELTVDYGFLTIISKPLFWLLEYIHSVLGNWGWAIVILTLLIKLAFYKLSEVSYKSMANMRKLAPKMAALRERYGDDRQRMSQSLMELYKKEKINPFGGCLPMLVQIPVFIALYWVLLESVELRHAPFILWIHDLSTKDPFYILPLLMGITMFIQQKLNPAPPDPVQAKVMMALPFIFTLFFAFFPAGLVLYWFVNNLLSIAQQWVITRRIERGDAA